MKKTSSLIIFFLLVFSISCYAVINQNCYINEDFEDYVNFSIMIDSGIWNEGDGSPSNYMGIIGFGDDQELRIENSVGSANTIYASILTGLNDSDFLMDCTYNDITMEFDLTVNSLDWQITPGIQSWLFFANISTSGQPSDSQSVVELKIDPDDLLFTDRVDNPITDVNIGLSEHWKIIATNNADSSLCTIYYYQNGVYVGESTSVTSFINHTVINTGNNVLVDTIWDWDNIQVYDGSSTNWCGSTYEESINATLEIGNSCIDDSECITGKCDKGQCVFKLFSEGCLYDYECLSGECINTRCSKPSLGEMIIQSKTEQFGDDSITNNFLSLFMAVGLMIVIIIASKGHIAGIFGGAIACVGSMVFFTIIGWLSPFILFMVFFVMIVLGVLVAILFNGGS